MNSLLAKHRNGERVTLADKLWAEQSLEELDAMVAACGARGQTLTAEELLAYRERRKVLEKSSA